MPQHIKTHLHLRARLRDVWTSTKSAIKAIIHGKDRHASMHETHDEDIYDAHRNDVTEDESDGESSQAWNEDSLRRVASGERRERERWARRNGRRRNRWGY
ncbi:hypothetical protein EDC01DRAFT_776852 [Geopyxis carbonaria]|nr:hypothetical protein EDC01DRAFT_776852 [Geopyxis carbonaria]